MSCRHGTSGRHERGENREWASSRAGQHADALRGTAWRAGWMGGVAHVAGGPCEWRVEVRRVAAGLGFAVGHGTLPRLPAWEAGALPTALSRVFHADAEYRDGMPPRLDCGKVTQAVGRELLGEPAVALRRARLEQSDAGDVGDAAVGLGWLGHRRSRRTSERRVEFAFCDELARPWPVVIRWGSAALCPSHPTALRPGFVGVRAEPPGSRRGL